MRYLNGVDVKKDYKADICCLLKQEKEYDSFEVKSKVGQAPVSNFYERLFPKRIEFSIPFYSKGPKAIAFYIQYFAEYGLCMTNI